MLDDVKQENGDGAGEDQPRFQHKETPFDDLQIGHLTAVFTGLAPPKARGFILFDKAA